VAWRPVGVPGRAGTKTGEVSSVLADAVDAPEVGATEEARGDAAIVPEAVTASGTAAACMDDDPVRSV